jgi:Kinetochore CENP-C fungal homologue, Mif2, N-terminal
MFQFQLGRRGKREQRMTKSACKQSKVTHISMSDDDEEPKQKSNRIVLHHRPGIVGRCTGLRILRDQVAKDDDGLDNVDDFFNSRNESIDVPREQEEQEEQEVDVSIDMSISLSVDEQDDPVQAVDKQIQIDKEEEKEEEKEGEQFVQKNDVEQFDYAIDDFEPWMPDCDDETVKPLSTPPNSGSSSSSNSSMTSFDENVDITMELLDRPQKAVWGGKQQRTPVVVASKRQRRVRAKFYDEPDSEIAAEFMNTADVTVHDDDDGDETFGRSRLLSDDDDDDDDSNGGRLKVVPEDSIVLTPLMHDPRRSRRRRHRKRKSPDGNKMGAAIGAVHRVEPAVLMPTPPAPPVGVRRSGRRRMKPLAFWKGERVVYQTSGGAALDVVDVFVENSPMQ